jgi:hypothetical protein
VKPSTKLQYADLQDVSCNLSQVNLTEEYEQVQSSQKHISVHDSYRPTLSTGMQEESSKGSLSEIVDLGNLPPIELKNCHLVS